MGPIFKILSPTEWESFQRDGYFKGNAIDIADGYIHSAYKSQIDHILIRFFTNVRPIVLTEVDPELLAPAIIKVELDEKSGNEYPHIYGAIPLKALVSYRLLEA